jgi:FAD/FMN-containing dehydrogenase
MSQLAENPAPRSPTTRPGAVSPEIVVFPDDPRWDDARRAWNLAVDQRPALVALPRSVADVVAVVEHARLLGLRIAVQGTGHGAAARGPLDGAVLLNTKELTGVTIDPVARVARVEAGTIWADVVEAAVAHGLTALHGSAPDVGVVGYVLGGGIGWYARKHGLASSSVRAVELVTPAGEVLRADATTNADLFWALRGGGGSFGVVTAVEIELLSITEAYAGWLVWPIERAAEVLLAWACWADAAPDEVTSVGRLLQIPPIPEMPELLRGRQLVVVEAAFLGDEAAGRELLAPLRALGPEVDTFTSCPAIALTELHQDPPHPVPGVGDGWLLEGVDGEVVDGIVAAAAMDGTSPLLSVELRQLGGALGRPGAGAGALSHFDAPYALYAVGSPMGPVTEESIRERIDAIVTATEPWSDGSGYLNFSERARDPRTLFPSGVAERLAEVRAAVDPDRVMLANHVV